MARALASRSRAPTVASDSRTIHIHAANMVYESDFYTTRRPYRPYTSYSYSLLSDIYTLPYYHYYPSSSLLPYYFDRTSLLPSDYEKTSSVLPYYYYRYSSLPSYYRSSYLPSYTSTYTSLLPSYSSTSLLPYYYYRYSSPLPYYRYSSLPSYYYRSSYLPSYYYRSSYLPSYYYRSSSSLLPYLYDKYSSLLPYFSDRTSSLLPYYFYRSSLDPYYFYKSSTVDPYYYDYSLPSLTYTPRLTKTETTYRPSVRTVTRLSTYPDPPHHIIRIRVRPSVILRELDRIQYRPRRALAISAVDDFLRSESTKAFEDETSRIRAHTNALIRRARCYVPRASSVAPLDTIYKYSYGEPLPYRFSNDDYVHRMLWPLRYGDSYKHIAYWDEPAKRFTGRGHLACLHYSGNKGFSDRRSFYKEPLSIRDDVNLLSFYAKNRLAANGLAIEGATAGGAQEQPTAA